MPTSHAVLIIGVTGGTGLACLHQLVNHPTKPQVHAFCRDPNRLAKEERALCTSIVQGDARKSQDIERALRLTGADVVILTTGTGESAAKSDIRTATGESLARAMKKSENKHVKAVIVSGMGASESRIIVGFGNWKGMLYEFYLRHVIVDHTGQEAAFRDDEQLHDRTLVVRPTLLVDTKNNAGSKLVTFGDTDPCPTIGCHRIDVASWIVSEIIDGVEGGRSVNITNALEV